MNHQAVAPLAPHAPLQKEGLLSCGDRHSLPKVMELEGLSPKLLEICTVQPLFGIFEPRTR